MLHAVDRHRTDASAPPRRCERCRAHLAQVDDRLDLDACALELLRHREALGIGAYDDGGCAGAKGPVVDEAPDRGRQHHADQVVAGEDERLLDRAGRDDDPLGTDPVEEVAGVDGHEPALVNRERPGRRQHLVRAGCRGGRLLIDEEDAAALRRGRRGGFAAGGAAADDEHIDAPVLGVVAARVPAVLVDLAEAGDAAQEVLVHRPQTPRPDHRAVVEADRCEGAADLVGDRQQIALERAAHVLGTNIRARTERLDADAHVRHAVDRHQAVRAAARAAEETARPVVLEAPREHAATRGIERRPDRVTCQPVRRPALECERERRRAVDPLTRLRSQAHQAADGSGSGLAGGGISVASTSFVRVSRSATNQRPQPTR